MGAVAFSMPPLACPLDVRHHRQGAEPWRLQNVKALVPRNVSFAMARVEDAFVQVERLHERFCEAFDRVEMLSGVIAEQTVAGVDVTHLRGKINEAEAEKKALLAALRMARHRKSVPISSINSGATSTCVAAER
jgi:hypothetical protein